MKPKFRFLLFTLFGALCLIAAAFWNRYPIVYSDDATYLTSGFGWQTPFDRPISYGIFLNLASLHGVSLWPVILLQSVILSALLLLTTKLVFGEKYFKPGIVTIICLAFTTGVSWTTSQLMPDIFTPIALLSLVLILSERFSQWRLALLYAVFFFTISTHISHVMIFGLILLFAFLFRKRVLPPEKYPRRNRHILVLFALTLCAIATMSSAIAKSKHVFFMGAMVEHGIAKAYLDENCATHSYKLCAYKDSLPAHAYDFIWNPKSPLYKIGGWSASKAEFNSIIRNTLTQPEFLGMHLKASAVATLQQMERFRIGDGNGSFADTTVLHQRIAFYFPGEVKSFSSSRQNTAPMNFDFFNAFFIVVVLLSLLLIFTLAGWRKNIFTAEIKLLTVFVFAGILINAWNCGTFANAIDRLGCKMIWLIPFVALLLVQKFILMRKKK